MFPGLSFKVGTDPALWSIQLEDNLQGVDETPLPAERKPFQKLVLVGVGKHSFFRGMTQDVVSGRLITDPDGMVAMDFKPFRLIGHSYVSNGIAGNTGGTSTAPFDGFIVRSETRDAVNAITGTPDKKWSLGLSATDALEITAGSAGPKVTVAAADGLLTAPKVNKSIIRHG